MAARYSRDFVAFLLFLILRLATEGTANAFAKVAILRAFCSGSAFAFWIPASLRASNVASAFNFFMIALWVSRRFWERMTRFMLLRLASRRYGWSGSEKNCVISLLLALQRSGVQICFCVWLWALQRSGWSAQYLRIFLRRASSRRFGFFESPMAPDTILPILQPALRPLTKNLE
jgi:hypothetical protein